MADHVWIVSEYHEPQPIIVCASPETAEARLIELRDKRRAKARVAARNSRDEVAR